MPMLSLRRTTTARLALAAALGLGTAALAGPPPESKAPDQAATGGKLYAKYCSKCHGAGGEGTADAPPVVGKDALPLEPRAAAKVRKTRFKTAADVLEFISANMPGDKAGSLGPAQYEAILAFDLKANGVDVTGKKIDAKAAKAIVLHP